jgi:oxygen-independent coproporphyrinogen III oxidase
MIRHLYLHVPFCARICPYCSFYKSRASGGKFNEYVGAVLNEASGWRGRTAPETVFIGGGTPTVLRTELLVRLVRGLREIFDWSGVAECTVEMNPATVSADKAAALIEEGATRASMGVQSWDPRLLKVLGRTHTPSTAMRSFHILRDAGFRNINIDLIFGIPGQTTGDWRHTLETTLALEPDHISAYSLTYEEDTEFFRRVAGGTMLPDPGLDADLFALTHDMLEESGFEACETSNFCKPGRACAHNLAIWNGADYLGLGPSAVSTVCGTRRANVCDTDAYLAAISAHGEAVADRQIIGPEERRIERIALGLRTASGIDNQIVGDTAFLPRLEDEGLVEQREGRIVLTRRGRPLADEIALALIS